MQARGLAAEGEGLGLVWTWLLHTYAWVSSPISWHVESSICTVGEGNGARPRLNQDGCTGTDESLTIGLTDPSRGIRKVRNPWISSTCHSLGFLKQAGLKLRFKNDLDL